MKKRLLSFLLALVFVFQLTLPMVVFSAEPVNNDAYVWDLTPLFKNDEECRKRADELVLEISKLSYYRDKISDTQMHLEFLEKENLIGDDILKIYYYGYLKYSKNVTDETGREFMNKGQDLLTMFNSSTQFYNMAVMALSKEELYEIINDDRFIDYRSFYQTIYDNWEYYHYYYYESDASIVYNTLMPLFQSEDVYQILTMGEMGYNTITLDDGRVFPVNELTISAFLKHNDPKVRKEAFDAYYGSYGNYRNTLAALYNNNVKVKVTSTSLTGGMSVLQSSLSGDALTDRAFRKMKTNLLAGADDFKEMQSIIVKAGGHEFLNDYDFNYYNYVTAPDEEYTLDQAKEDILNALAPLGEDYVNNIKRAFDEGWIDAYSTEGKVSGAFALDTPAHPYILLNATGTVYDGESLAHELGHAMHMLYTAQNCTRENRGVSTSTTETAAMVNEQLFLKYKYDNAQSEEDKMYYAYKIVSGLRNSSYDQLMYTEFEEKTHRQVEYGGVLSASFLESAWLDLEKEYYQTDYYKVSDSVKYAWSMIPHFYSDFYCLNYCFAAVAASNAVNVIESEEGRAKYIKFLSSGYERNAVDTLKLVDIDIESDITYQNFFANYNTYLDIFEELSVSHFKEQ